MEELAWNLSLAPGSVRYAVSKDHLANIVNFGMSSSGFQRFRDNVSEFVVLTHSHEVLMILR